MQTVQPCVTIGSYIWAQDRLPYDEFTLRLDELRAAMERNGWPAVLVYGDVREHAALAFLSSFIPRVRWGMALLPRTGDARLLCAMSTRDLPAMRTLTWIADVRSGMGPEWAERIRSVVRWPQRRSGAKTRHARLRHHGAGALRRGAPQPRRSVRVATRRRHRGHSVAPQAAARADDDAGVVQIARNRGKNLCRELAQQPRAGNRGARCRTSRAFAAPRRMCARW